MTLFTSQEDIEKEMKFGTRKDYDDLEPYHQQERKLNLEGGIKEHENNNMRKL
jgi:cell fate (sporulation/competence/biofilm development) regulator YlbF (YheA/YmcA/DUF963 family)